MAAAYNLAGNVNLDALEQMADGAAHTVLTFVLATSAVNGTARAADPAIANQLDFRGSLWRR
jgi:hypothetical protein